jgi:Fe-S cluster biosynthesis and repair protein YggX
MADYYLKNSTGETKEVSDLGIVIANGQSITISKDDFDVEEVESKTEELEKEMQEIGKKIYEAAAKEAYSKTSQAIQLLIIMMTSLIM